MKCTEARPLLDPLCDGALEPKDSALVLDHLKTCQECQNDWQSLEDLHANFQQAKGMTQIPAGMMDKISDKLKDAEATERKQHLLAYDRIIPILAVAACFATVGFLAVAFISKPAEVQLALQSARSAAADTLIEDVEPATMLTPVADRTELAKDIGFEIKYVRLPDWKMDRSSMIQSKNSKPIARFDFVRKSQSGFERMTCYQAPQGFIRTADATMQNIQGKQVFFGHHGKFQFALWSQNGRDYLFVTSLPLPELEGIVRGA
jgi:anti-sigma factor RsiW